MKRHNNKYWKKEKEYISLLNQLDLLCDIYPVIRWRILGDSQIERIRRKLRFDFYGLYYGWTNTAPKHYRKHLNKKRRKSNKNLLKRELMGYNISYDDNYKDASWYW